MMNGDEKTALIQCFGAIFYSILSLFDDRAELETLLLLQKSLDNGSIADPDAREIMRAIVNSSVEYRKLMPTEFFLSGSVEAN